MADENTKKQEEKRVTSATDRGRPVSQADGTAAQDQPGETQAQPNSTNSETSRVNREPSQNRTGQIDPSAPTESTEGGRVTQHLVGSGPSTMDSSGEVGHPSGKGTLEVDEQQITTDPDPTASTTGKPEAGEGSDENQKPPEDDEEAAA